MNRLAAWLDSFRANTKDALRTAAEQGFRSVHANALSGDLRPDRLTASGRRHLAKYLRDLGLQLDALSAAFPGGGLADPAVADQRLAEFRATLELCADLGVRNAGVSLTGFEDDSRKSLAGELVPVVAELADRFGIVVSIDNREDSLSAVADRVRLADCHFLRFALDTAIHTANPATLAPIARHIGAVYLRDVRRVGDRFEEVPYGAGDVNFPETIATLETTGFHDAYVLRRDDRNVAVDALRQGREYMAPLVDG